LDIYFAFWIFLPAKSQNSGLIKLKQRNRLHVLTALLAQFQRLRGGDRDVASKLFHNGVQNRHSVSGNLSSLFVRYPTSVQNGKLYLSFVNLKLNRLTIFCRYDCICSKNGYKMVGFVNFCKVFEK
jgi:hypothetical protein